MSSFPYVPDPYKPEPDEPETTPEQLEEFWSDAENLAGELDDLTFELISTAAALQNTVDNLNDQLRFIYDSSVFEVGPFDRERGTELCLTLSDTASRLKDFTLQPPALALQSVIKDLNEMNKRNSLC